MKYSDGDIIVRYGVRFVILGASSNNYFYYVDKLTKKPLFRIMWERLRGSMIHRIFYALYPKTEYFMYSELNLDEVLLTTLSDETKIGEVDKREFYAWLAKNRLVLQDQYPAVETSLYQRDVIDAYDKHPFVKALKEVQQNIRYVESGIIKPSALHISTRKGQILIIKEGSLYSMVYVEENDIVLLYSGSNVFSILDGVLLEHKLDLDAFDDECVTWQIGEIPCI